MRKTLILDHKESRILRQIAKSVPLKDIGTKKLDAIITKMKKALHGEEDGVAIAAPQIGVALRIFVISGKLFAMKRGSDKKLSADKDAAEKPDMVFINPKLTKVSKKKQKMEEGCLSVRWLYGKVERSEKATVRAYDERGKAFTKGASGLLAQAFQHETDHLDGVLFIDKATEIEDLPPPKDRHNE